MEPIADKKKLILDSTLEMVKDHGFHGCPISAVAKNAGVAAGSVYTYFESKDELMLELFHHVKDTIYLKVSENDDPSLEYKERFFNFWNCLTQLYLEKPAIQRFFEQFMNSPYNTPELQNQASRWYDWNDNFFKEGIDQGYLKNLDPRIISIMVLGNINSLTRIQVNYSSALSTKGIQLNGISEMVWDAIKKQ
jgi:AcrR family transcriptional regulator